MSLETIFIFLILLVIVILIGFIFLKMKTLDTDISQKLNLEVSEIQKSLNSQLLQTNNLLQQNINEVNNNVNQSLLLNNKDIAQNLQQVNEQINQTLRVNTSDLHSNLTSNTKNINELLLSLSNQMIEVKSSSADFSKIGSELKEIMSSSQKRGKLGEIMLENILSDVLPSEAWSKQYNLHTGIVDIAVFTRDLIIPIDCKFPLANYANWLKAENELKPQFLKKFHRDVKARIDETSKYVLPEFNTSDYAIMYLPAESIFLEVINDYDLVNYATSRQVLIASPINLFYILHTINETIKREKLPEQFEAIFQKWLKHQSNIVEFEKEYIILLKHLKNAYNKSISLEEHLNSIVNQSDSITLTKQEL